MKETGGTLVARGRVRTEFKIEEHNVETLNLQLQRVLGHLAAKPNDLERFIYLIGLADRNETLFYKVLMSDPARFVPIVYDPTVAEGCLKFGHIYRRARGMYVTKHMIPIQKVNEAYDRLVKGDVKYRFAIDVGVLEVRVTSDHLRVIENSASKIRIVGEH
jgi:malic enzyme